MDKVNFKFSTDILRRLGEELNPNPDQGILELVKNAYDADARTCTVDLLARKRLVGSFVSLMTAMVWMQRPFLMAGWYWELR